MPISNLFLDLDGTLYSNNNGMWELIAARMENYMHEVLGIPKQDVPAVRRQYFLKYGTTLSGLIANHEVDAEHYLAYVHDIPVADFLSPDQNLRTMLLGIPQPKWILTNADKSHAIRVLKALDLFDLFEGILDITLMGLINKPNPLVFQKALEYSGNPLPNQSVFVDDIPHNLAPAKDLGWITVLVGEKPNLGEADYQIESIYLLRKLLEKISHG